MIVIGLSRGSGNPKYGNYTRWLMSGGEEIEIIDFEASTDRDADAQRIDALVLSGGEDVDPEFYGHEEYRSKCETIDLVRDRVELRLLDVAIEREIPILGICRGLQILNVHQGGTLIPHLPDVLDGSPIHAKDGARDRVHPVSVTSGSLLLKATGELGGEVNSAHHQAIDTLAPGVVVTARAHDGTIEAIEWAERSGKSYMLAVQWHPERMENQESPFSRGVLEQFLFEAHSSAILARVSKVPPKPEQEPPPAPEGEGPSGPILPIIPTINS